MCVWVWVCVAVKWGCGEAYETGVCLGVGVCGGGGSARSSRSYPPYTHTHSSPPHTHTTLTRTAFGELFAALDRCEALLGGQRYLAGARLTEADIRLFVTLIRFDPVYGAEGGGGGKEG